MPPTVPPASDAPLDPNDLMVKVPMAPEDAKKWRTRIAKAQEVQAKLHPWWEAAIKNYAPTSTETPSSYETLRVRTNRLFTIVERKEADLFYQKPDVTVTPSPLLDQVPNNPAMAAAHADIINQKLGLTGINAKKLAQEAIFSYELFGIGCSKIFYKAYSVETQQPQYQVGLDGTPLMDPMSNQPVPMLDASGQPMTETVPVVIKAECGWEAFSPMQFLVPSDFRSTEFDKAPWQGMRFTMPLAEGRRQWGNKIPEDFGSNGENTKAKGADESQHFDENPHGDSSPSTDEITGTEIYYRSYLYRPDIAHPDHLTKCVLIDGLDEPVEHRDDPDQTIDEQFRLTPDSRIGYPYHPLVIRVMTDSAWVMSDAAISLPLTQELDKSRGQRVRQRDINLVKFYYDTGKIPETEINKFVGAEQGGLIGLPSDAMTDPQGPIRALQSTPIPYDNFQTDQQIDNDLARTFGVDADASGVTGSTDQTATEASLRQANRNARAGKEQGFVGDWYVTGVIKLSTLIQRYFSVEDAAAIIGQQNAQMWDTWRKQIPTRLAFHMTPDSSLRNDTALDRLQAQQLYSYLANDPNVNRKYLLERLLLRFHLDPSKALLPQPPEAQPEPPKASLSFKGEDLSPLAPQSPIVLDILMKLGMEIDPVALETARQLGVDVAAAEVVKKAAESEGKERARQTEHGGKVAPMESLDRHLADRTGGMQNSGDMMPGMAGGQPTGIQ